MKPTPKAKKTEVLARKQVHCDADKTDPTATAKNYATLVISPELAAYRVIAGAEHASMTDTVDVPTLVQTLREQGAAANRNDLSQAEAMLMNQATALQTLFARMAERATGAEYMPNFEIFMRTALKAQSQCRATLETLAAIKNPPLVYAKQANITTIVAHPDQGKSNENGTQPEYLVSQFTYNKENNTYTCPQGQTLTTTGSWHNKTGRTEESGYQFQKYRTPACKTCPVKDLCTSRKGGREIDRSQYADAVEENHQRYKDNPQRYRKRQEINEHIFGTIKRKWGYNYTDLIGLEKVNGEHSLIMLVYNIKRSINILGVPELIAKLHKWNSPYKAKVLLWLKTDYLKGISACFFGQTKLAT